MGYTALKIAAFLIQLFAVLMALFVIALFISLLIIPATLQNSINTFNQQLPHDLAGLMSSIITLTALTPFSFLFSGLLSSLLIFGFGGLLSVIVDIARSLRVQALREYIPAPDDDPVNAKPWADFPASAYTKRPKKTVRPTPKGKWDVGQ